MPNALLTVLIATPAALALVAVVFALAMARREQRALQRIEKAPLRTSLPVIIPARNEGARIRATLDALLRDPSEKLEVLVYDDQSTDNTADIVREVAKRDPRVTLLAARADDHDGEGFGKPLALHRAVRHVDPSAHRLLFLDADVLVEPGTLGGMVRVLESTKAGALSGTPRILTSSVVEDMLVPAFVSLVALKHRPSRVNDIGYQDAFLNGQMILVDRHAYDEIGGFHSVKDTVLEDVALGMRLKRHRFGIRLADLRPHVATRMYQSFAEIRAGFGKNMIPLLGGPATTLAVAALGIVTAFLPVTALVAASLIAPVALAIVAPLVVATIVVQSQLRASMGVAKWPALIVPFTQILVAGILFESVVKTWSGGEVEWRGRRYRAAKTIPDSIHDPTERMRDLDGWLSERVSAPPRVLTAEPIDTDPSPSSETNSSAAKTV